VKMLLQKNKKIIILISKLNQADSCSLLVEIDDLLSYFTSAILNLGHPK
jgi:hypothetical protein